MREEFQEELPTLQPASAALLQAGFSMLSSVVSQTCGYGPPEDGLGPPRNDWGFMLWEHTQGKGASLRSEG